MALTDNLVEFWTLNNTLTGINGNTLVSPDGLTHYVAGKIGQAWDCANDGYRSLYGNPSPWNPGSGSWSLSFWLRLPAAGWTGNSYLFRLRDATTAKLSIYVPAYQNNDDPEAGPIGWETSIYYLIFGATGVAIPLAAPEPETWHHAVFWFDSATGKLTYTVDGATYSPVDAVQAAITSPNLVLGATRPRSEGTNAPWRDRLDCVGLWSRALTEDEVSELYAAGAGWEPTVTSGAINIRIAHILTCRQCGARMTRNYDFHAEESDATQ
jgi:hypothetical protein